MAAEEAEKTKRHWRQPGPKAVGERSDILVFITFITFINSINFSTILTPVTLHNSQLVN